MPSWTARRQPAATEIHDIALQVATAPATDAHAAMPPRLMSRAERQHAREHAAALAGMGVVSLIVLPLASAAALPIMCGVSVAVMLLASAALL